MYRTGITCGSENQATMSANVFGLVFDNRTLEDGISHVTSCYELTFRGHTMKRMRKVENALSCRRLHFYKKLLFQPIVS